MTQVLRIDTEHLYMAPLKIEDAGSMLEYHSDADVVRYIPWSVRDLDMVREALDKYMTLTKLESEGDYLMLGLYRKSDDQLVGQMNAMYQSENNKLAEFGYVLNPRFMGNGYATEAARALISWIFATGNFQRVIAKMDARNQNSASLCERLGLRREGHHLQDDWFKEEWTDTYLYAILKSEWNKLHSSYPQLDPRD